MSWFLNNLLKKSQNVFASPGSSLQIIRQEHARLDNKSHRVNNLEKKFLVWTGKYKSVEEVPAFVEQNVVERARNRMRIRISNYMMAATLVGCLIMVYFGKQAAGKGDSLAKQNIEWHRQYNEAEAKK